MLVHTSVSLHRLVLLSEMSCFRNDQLEPPGPSSCSLGFIQSWVNVCALAVLSTCLPYCMYYSAVRPTRLRVFIASYYTCHQCLAQGLSLEDVVSKYLPMNRILIRQFCQEWCLNGMKSSSDPLSFGSKYLFQFFFFFVLLLSTKLDFNLDC